MEDFDKLWNYNDPVATENNFKEILKKSGDKPSTYVVQLLSQLARTYSLRGMFSEAHILLSEAKQKLSGEPGVAHLRLHLELGRTLLGESKRQEAKIEFEQAEKIAMQTGEEFHQVDALHMLGILSTGAEQVRMNEAAIEAALVSKDELARNWLGALYNNLGWTFFDLQEYEKSLSIFLRALQWREERKGTAEIFLAKWCVARVLRALHRWDDAIKVQLALFEEATQTGQPDGYVHEELGELYLLKKDKLKSTFHFEKAYNLLSEDPYIQDNEVERLERILSLAKM